MIVINATDVVKKPSYITKPKDITFIEDAKQHKANYTKLQIKTAE